MSVPNEAVIVERIQETPSIFTLRLRFTDPEIQRTYRFAPGQFNMLYLYGIGEIPISIVSDPRDDQLLDHTIRNVGRVTSGFAQLKAGDRIGVRGPFGRGWPMQQAEGKDVVVITGGLGCAPVVSVIHYVLRRRAQFGRLTIMQGVKHADDLIWREQYEAWSRLPDTQVLLAASQGGPLWPWRVGKVPVLFDEAQLNGNESTVMMCGPEGMMCASIPELRKRGVADENIWLSMERNMQCGVGKCGHCQHGGHFVCKNGPVFPLPEVAPLLGIRGF